MGAFLQAQRPALQRGANSTIYSGLGAPLARAHEGFGFRELLKGSHKDTFSPQWPGGKTARARHKERVVPHQPGSRQILSKQLKERSGQNTQEKNESSGSGSR